MCRLEKKGFRIATEIEGSLKLTNGKWVPCRIIGVSGTSVRRSQSGVGEVWMFVPLAQTECFQKEERIMPVVCRVQWPIPRDGVAYDLVTRGFMRMCYEVPAWINQMNNSLLVIFSAMTKEFKPRIRE